MKNKCTWEIYTDDQMSKCDDFCAGYMDFLSEGKTERECVEIIIKEAQAAFMPILDYAKNCPAVQDYSAFLDETGILS